MITKERLDMLNREADAADDAYQSALETEHVPMTLRYQPTLLSPRIRALKEAADAALRRRYDATIAHERDSG